MTESASSSVTSVPGRASEAIHPVDVIVAVGLAGLSLLPYVGGTVALGQLGLLSITLLLLESLPLIVRRRFPLAVMLTIVTATIVHIAITPDDQGFQAGLGILVAIYTVGERLDRQTSIGLTVLTGVIVAALFIAKADLTTALQDLVQTELILGVAWLVGDASRARRLYQQSLIEQERLADREREERTRRAVLEERERIARELHDVVAHDVSVMVIQAGGAVRSIDRRPEESKVALEAIATTGRQALTDMRRMVGMLGHGESADPMPGLDGLDGLIAQTRSAGLDVEVSVEGDRRPLDPGMELSAYRIIQEALTNALKHAAGGRAWVIVRYSPGELDISIEDERGPQPVPELEPAHEGRGLVNIRERVTMLRGTFAAQPTGTGFRVAVTLPIEGAAAS